MNSRTATGQKPATADASAKSDVTPKNDVISKSSDSTAPLIAGVVVHWRNEHELSELLEAWPDDPRFSLCVVDNSGSVETLVNTHSFVRWLNPKRNLGFGGGVNAGVEASTGDWILLLNPDTRVGLATLEILAEEARSWSTQDSSVAMVIPRLVDGDGNTSQFTWQLRPLTKKHHLLAQCAFLSRPRGPTVEPASGSIVAQPAAAALLVRRDAFEEVDGFDPQFAPAWFEDVDFAYRMHDAGFTGRYLPEARVVHEGGASVPSLGFGRFLRIYYRNLQRFARARGWPILATLAPWLIALASIARLPTLLLRKPKAATSRTGAFVGLVQLAVSAISGWRWPRPFLEDGLGQNRAVEHGVGENHTEANH